MKPIRERVLRRFQRNAARIGQHFNRAPIQIGDPGLLVGFGDDQKAPVLRVDSGRGLGGDLDALFDHFGFDRALEIDPAAHRTRGP